MEVILQPRIKNHMQKKMEDEAESWVVTQGV